MKGKLIAGVALVFIVGVLIGSVGTRLFFRHHHEAFTGERANRTAFIMKRLSKELKLTDTQKVAVQHIVEQTQDRLRAHFVEQRPEVQAIVNDGFLRVKNELTDDQKKKLDELKEKFERRRHGGQGEQKAEGMR